MDLLQRLGGRKFLMALIVLGVGTYIEIVKASGLSQNMVMLLVGLVGVFSAANHATTAAYMKSRQGGSGSAGLDPALAEKINVIHAAAMKSQDPENPGTKQLRELLAGLNQRLNQVQETTSQVGLSMVNIGTEVRKIKNAVAQP